MCAMPSSYNSRCDTTRGLPQDGQRRPVSKGVMQSRQRLGIVAAQNSGKRKTGISVCSPERINHLSARNSPCLLVTSCCACTVMTNPGCYGRGFGTCPVAAAKVLNRRWKTPCAKRGRSSRSRFRRRKSGGAAHIPRPTGSPRGFS